MKYTYIVEVIIFSIITFLFGNFIKTYTRNMIYVILNYIVGASLIISSLLLNLDNYLYSLSFTIISFLIIVGFINKFIIIDQKYNIVFWLYIIVTAITLTGFILTKKYIYNSINSNAPRGDQGIQGNIGKAGKSYFLETFSERCYSDLINSIEDYIKSVKGTNNIDKNKTYFNNMFLKEKIKDICTSNNFIRLFDTFNNNCIHNGTNRYCENTGEECNISNEACDTDISNEEKYNKILNNLKEIIVDKDYNDDNDKSWIQHILENSCNEDNALKNKLNIKSYEKLYRDSDTNSDTNHDRMIQKYDIRRHNNKEGMKYLYSDFKHENYFDELISKPKNRETNPFENIRKNENNQLLLNINNVNFSVINKILNK